MSGKGRAFLLATAAAALLSACAGQSQVPTHEDGITVLRQAIAYAGPELAEWREACVVTRLQAGFLTAGDIASRLETIPLWWLPAHVETTHVWDGCEQTLAYERPVFSAVPELGAYLATVEVDARCGPLCGHRGNISFYRLSGETEWKPLGYLDTGIVY